VSDIHDALVAYADDAPPPAFSYDRILAAGRRSRRRRRIVTAGAATTVVAVAIGVALVTQPHRDPPAPYTPAGPSWSTLDPAPYCRTAGAPASGPAIAPTTIVSEKNGHRIRIPTEPAGHAAARISCYLARVVPARLPGATYHRDLSTPAGTVPLQAYPSRIFDPARPGDTSPPSIVASAVVTDDQGVGDIGFRAGAAYESAEAAAANCGPPQCTVRTGPRGATVTVLDSTTDAGYRLVNVLVHRGDTIILASASNGIPEAVVPSEAVATDTRRPGRRDLPLTVDELIEIAAAPEMDLFP